MEMTGVFASPYPSVPLAPDVDQQALHEGDPNPLYVVLPIAKVGVTSRNGRHYDREAVTAVVEAVMRKRPDGIKGHLTDEERGYRFDVPPLIWVGAVLDESTGIVWAKAYVMTSATDVREYIRAKRAVKGQIGTSIYGTAEGYYEDDGTFRVVSLDIETIDLAHPDRVGVTATAATPVTTREMAEDTPAPDADPETAVAAQGESGGESDPAALSIENQVEELVTMPEATPVVVPTTPVTPAPAEPVSESEVVRTLKREQQAEVRRLTELNNANADKLADYDSFVALIGETDDPILALRSKLAELESLKRENGALLEESIKAQVGAKVAVEALRPMVVELVRATKPVRRTDVTTALESVLAKPEVVTMIKAGVQEAMGDPQSRPQGQNPANQNNGGGDDFFAYGGL